MAVIADLGLEGDEATGANIVRRACDEPLAGSPRTAVRGYVVAKVRELGPGNGYNGAEEYGDLIKRASSTRSSHLLGAAQRGLDREHGAHDRHPGRGEEGRRSR